MPKIHKFKRLDGDLTKKHDYDIEKMTDEHAVCFQPSKMNAGQLGKFETFLTDFENAEKPAKSDFATYVRMPGSPPPP